MRRNPAYVFISVTTVSLFVTTAALAPAGAAVDNHIKLVSVATPETTANGSYPTSISADGRYVVFASEQPNLVPGAPADGLGRYVYLRDTVAGTTTRLSKGGANGNNGYLLGNAAISADGKYTVFGNNEVPDGPSALRLYNRVSGSTKVISPAAPAGTNRLNWFTVSISDNGRYVDYTRTVLVDNVVNETRLYRYDIVAKTTTELGQGLLGGPQDRPNYATGVSTSANGRYVTYLQAVEPTKQTSAYQLIRLDTTTGVRQVIKTSAPQYVPINAFGNPSISDTGRFIAYQDYLADGRIAAFLWDANTGASRQVAANAPGLPSSDSPQVSGDGRYVAFAGRVTQPYEGAPPSATIFVWNRTADTAEPIVRNLQGKFPASTGATSVMPYIDGDGSAVAFVSRAQSLAPGADTRLERTFVWNRP